jgi:hypothetical protein
LHFQWESFAERLRGGDGPFHWADIDRSPGDRAMHRSKLFRHLGTLGRQFGIEIPTVGPSLTVNRLAMTEKIEF